MSGTGDSIELSAPPAKHHNVLFVTAGSRSSPAKMKETDYENTDKIPHLGRRLSGVVHGGLCQSQSP
jgi:hypothetical protein